MCIAGYCLKFSFKEQDEGVMTHEPGQDPVSRARRSPVLKEQDEGVMTHGPRQDPVSRAGRSPVLKEQEKAS